jgi:hypothetical protein
VTARAAALALLACAWACLACEDPAVREAELRARADAAIAAGDHCAAGDALLVLAVHLEKHWQWADASDAAERGIDVLQGAETRAFLEGELERLRAASRERRSEEDARAAARSLADFAAKVAEMKRQSPLWIAPHADPSCTVNPPSVELHRAQLLALRTAILASRLDVAERRLANIEHGLGSLPQWPVYTPLSVDEQYAIQKRLQKRSPFHIELTRLRKLLAEERAADSRRKPAAASAPG